MSAEPKRREAEAVGASKVLLEVKDLARDFDVSRPWLNRVLEGSPRQILKAVDGVSFAINRGETLALVGESGCGKSTVARLICGLYAPSRGSVVFDGVDMARISQRAEMLRMRRRFQMIFQDPYASLNPRWRVGRIIAEPIRQHGIIQGEAAIQKRVRELLQDVRLRTNSPAGSDSASLLRAHSRPTPSSWSATSRRARWTSRCRRRF
jgi:peptide/nickel transport system ATP-binding protein